MSADLIVIEGVSKFYGEVLGVNRVSLSIPSGISSLVGPNGSGKTTLMNLMTGLIHPDRGSITIRGISSRDPENLMQITGYATQYDAAPRGTTGFEFVSTGLLLGGYSKSESEELAWNALELVDLTDAGHRKIAAYSKGMRQRVRLAQAIAHDPEVLLLDEPVAGMDPVNRRRVIELVRRMGREGKTVLVSSHILHEVEAMTRRVLLIHNGRILAEGDVREIRDLLDEHPHTVSMRARDPRKLAQAVVSWPSVLSLSFGGEGEWLTVQTGKPDDFYGALHDAALEAGVLEMYSPDEDLESVFRYLVNR